MEDIQSVFRAPVFLKKENMLFLKCSDFMRHMEPDEEVYGVRKNMHDFLKLFLLVYA